MSADFGINNQYFNDKPDLKGFNTRKAAGVNETFWGLFNEDKGVNGIIDEAVFQGNAGDCWLISGILSLSYTDEGKDLIQDAISKNPDGSYNVTFKGVDKTYTISNDELVRANKSSFLNGVGLADSKYSTGDDDMLLIELAMEKLVQEGDIPIETIEGITGGSAYYLYQLFTKNDVEYALGDDENEVKYLIDYYYQNQDTAAATLGVGDGFAGLEDDHAYAVKSVNQNYMELVNPWDTTENIKVSIKDLADNFGKYDFSIVDTGLMEQADYLEEYYA